MPLSAVETHKSNRQRYDASEQNGPRFPNRSTLDMSIDNLNDSIGRRKNGDMPDFRTLSVRGPSFG